MDKDFAGEAEELIDAMSQGLLKYENSLKAKGKVDPDILNGIFRAAHTLKGSCGVFGFQGMSKLAHAMENLLSRMRLGQLPIAQNILDALFEAIENLEAMIHSDSPNEVSPDKIILNLNNLADGRAEVVEVADNAVKDIIPPDIRKTLGEYEEHRLEENLQAKDISLVIVGVLFNMNNFDSGYKKVTDWLKKYGEIIAVLPNAKPDDPEKIGFQILFATEVNLQRLSQYLNKFNVRVNILRECSR